MCEMAYVVLELSLTPCLFALCLGEELVVSYLGTDHFQLREERRDVLRTVWGFDCTCPLCSLTGEHLQQNEKLRKHIKFLR